MNQGPRLLELSTPILNLILAKVKAYHFVASKYLIQSVAKKLNPETNPLLIIKRPTVTDIIAACDSAEDALNILSNPLLVRQLSGDNIIAIVSFHPGIARILTKKIDLSKIHLLGRHDLSLAKEIWQQRDQSAHQNSKSLHWGELGSYHLPLAEQMLAELLSSLRTKTPADTLNRLYPNRKQELIKLAGSHLPIAKKLIALAPSNKKRLGIPINFLSFIADSHEELLTTQLALPLLTEIGSAVEEQKYRFSFNGFYYEKILCYPNLVAKIFEIEWLPNVMSENYLITFALKFEFVAEKVQDNLRLYQESSFGAPGSLFPSRAIIEIAKRYLWLTERLLTTPMKAPLKPLTLTEQMTLLFFHRTLWMKCVPHSIFLNHVNVQNWSSMIRLPSYVAQYLLTRPDLWQTSIDLTQKMLASKLSIAKKLLNHPDFKFPMTDFFFHLPSSVQDHILNTPKLRSAFITPTLISTLFPQDPELGTRFAFKELKLTLQNIYKLLELPELWDHFSTQDLEHLARSYRSLNSKILSIPALKAKFKEDMTYIYSKTSLEKMDNFYTFIFEKASHLKDNLIKDSKLELAPALLFIPAETTPLPLPHSLKRAASTKNRGIKRPAI